MHGLVDQLAKEMVIDGVAAKVGKMVAKKDMPKVVSLAANVRVEKRVVLTVTKMVEKKVDHLAPDLVVHLVC